MTVKRFISSVKNYLYAYRSIFSIALIIVVFHRSLLNLLDKHIIPVVSQIPDNSPIIAVCFFALSIYICFIYHKQLEKAKYLISHALLIDVCTIGIHSVLKHHFGYVFYGFFNIEYFWLFLLPFLFVDICRIIKIAIKHPIKKNSSNSSFITDSPCDDASLVTERSVYAEHLIYHIFGTFKSYEKQDVKSNPFIGNGAFVINICEEYGYGKTSFFALMHKKLKKSWTDQYISFSYQPWLCEGKSAMVMEFFNRLREELSRYAPQINKNITDYLRTLLDKSDNIIIHFFRTTFCHSTSMYEERDRLKKEMVKIGKPIIIFIDDVDRLQREELLTLLNLVRDTADFQNVFYIMAADKVHLTNCLGDCGISNPDKYLKKIFNYEFMLPANDGLVMTFLQEKLTLILSKYIKEEGKVNRNVSSIINHENIALTFGNIRDVKRILNDYMMALSVIKSGPEAEIDYKDLFLLTIIKAFRPEVYKLLRDNADQLLCASNEIYILDRKYSDIYNEELIATIRAAGKIANTSHMSSDDTTEENKCKTIDDMMIVFQKLNDEFVANSLRYLFNSQRSSGDEINIKHKESYYKYFSGQLKKNQLSNLEVEEILCCDEENFQEQMKKIFNGHKTNSFIAKMIEWSKKWRNSPILFIRKVCLFIKEDLPIEYAKDSRGLGKRNFEDNVYYTHRIRYSQILYNLYHDSSRNKCEDNDKALLHQFILEDDHYDFSAITLNTLHGLLPYELTIKYDDLLLWRRDLIKLFINQKIRNNPFPFQDDILDIIPLLRGNVVDGPWEKEFSDYLDHNPNFIIWFEKMAIYRSGKFIWDEKYMDQLNFTFRGNFEDLIKNCSSSIQQDERIIDLTNLIRCPYLENENCEDHPFLSYLKNKYK